MQKMKTQFEQDFGCAIILTTAKIASGNLNCEDFSKVQDTITFFYNAIQNSQLAIMEEQLFESAQS